MQRKTMLEEFWSHATGRNIVLKDYSYAIRFDMPEKKARQPPDVLLGLFTDDKEQPA